MKELWVYLVNKLDELVLSIFLGMFQEIETTTGIMLFQSISCPRTVSDLFDDVFIGQGLN